MSEGGDSGCSAKLCWAALASFLVAVALLLQQGYDRGVYFVEYPTKVHHTNNITIIPAQNSSHANSTNDDSEQNSSHENSTNDDSEQNSASNSLLRMEDALKRIVQSKTEIRETWNISYFPLFLHTMDIPATVWQHEKRRYQSIFLRSPSVPFVVSFGGSSVTAGHDNYFNQSYPFVFERSLRPVFESLSIPLLVRNHALGNNPCYPYNACTDTHLGSDADIVAWEQSMNCGHDARPVETFLRSSLMMSKQPLVMFLLSGTPYWEAKECAAVDANDMPPTTTSTSDDTSIRNIAASNTLLEHMAFLHPSSGGTSVSLVDAYSAYGNIIGQSVFEPVNAYKCFGPYGATFGAKPSTLGAGKSWHPGVQGHLMRGHSLAYFLLSIMEDAINEIIVMIQNNKNVSALAKFSTVFTALPAPIACDSSVCSSSAQCYTEYEPRMSNSISIIREFPPGVTSDTSTWTLGLSWFDVAGVKKAEDRGAGYLDKKYIYTSSSTTEPLVLRIATKTYNHIWLCQVQRGFLKYPAGMAELNVGAEVRIDLHSDGKPLVSTDKMGTVLKLTHTSDECYQTDAVAGGNHTLYIWQASDNIKVNK